MRPTSCLIKEIQFHQAFYNNKGIMAEDDNKDDTKKDVAEPDAAASPPTKEGEDLDLDEDLAEALGEEETTEDIDVDQVIAESDPEFANELNQIASEDFSSAAIEKGAASEEVDENAAVPSAFKAWLSNLPKEIKQRYYIAAGLAAFFIPIALLVYNGKLLPRFDFPYTLSMDELTTEVYTYPVEGTKVPLFDEFRTKAHTVELPKTVINLRSSGSGSSYGEFSFSLVLRDEDLSSAIKAKQSEIIDLIQRVLEQITVKELEGPAGKEKVKKVIRHRLNEYLQGNVVLGVYYRSVILEK